MTENLLRREQFTKLVLARDPICMAEGCTEPSVDAHHILNRNLWTMPQNKGGYFLSNGVGLCSLHHYHAELTLLSIHDIRVALNQYEEANWEMPDTLSTERVMQYDTWGNEIISTGSRKPGPLFYDEGCQKALKAAGVLWMFIGR